MAEKTGGTWVVHQWLKKAVLLSFRLNDMELISGAPGGAGWWDKVPSKFAGMTAEAFKQAGYRAVPGAVVRHSAYIAPGVILMPSFVNLGAYVGSGTMVDTWATVGSCAQIGKNVHLSGGVGIGGVLEPLQANPTIIEDNCFVGARSEVVEGVVVGEGSVLSMGVFIGASTKVVDRATGKIHIGKVPPYSVVVSGHAAGQAVPQQRAGPIALLRGDRQDGRREDARQDQHQRAAARLGPPCQRCRPTARSTPKRSSTRFALLHQRICERFPGAGLAGVCAELLTMAEENSSRAEQDRAPQRAAACGDLRAAGAGAVALVWIAQLFSTVPGRRRQRLFRAAGHRGGAPTWWC